MVIVSVVMPCYNASKYLGISIQSVIDQKLKDWELIIVNDGSTDESEKIAHEYSKKDERIKVISKANGGYVSARIEGYKEVDKNSKYVIFYDADDRMSPDMLEILSIELEKNENVGAVYCDHRFMDEKGEIQTFGANMGRYVPTAFWLKELEEQVIETPFISIFCWTKMIEPMTLIRRTAYNQTPGWDIDFGKGTGNIGEGVYLFSEIALQWKVHYINKPLYFYRRHNTQMSAISSEKMSAQAFKVIDKWKERIKKEKRFAKKIIPAIIFLKYRIGAKQTLGSLPHQIRYYPVRAFKSIFVFGYNYLRSLTLLFYYRSLIDKNEFY